MSKSSSKNNKVSWISVVEVIVIIMLALMIIGMIACNFIFKNDGSATPFLGYTVYRTKAVNMVPQIPVNTVVIAKKSEIENIKEKSVILCKIGDRTTLTRVVRIDYENDKTYYVVKYDTTPAAETFRIESDAVIAKAVRQMDSFGKFLDFATSTIGIIIAVIIPLFTIILFQVIRIIGIRKLEDEASYMDDINDLDAILSRGEDEEAPPMKLSEPKFIEDVTGKFNALKPESVRQEPVRAAQRVRFETEPKFEPVLNVNSKGIAEYSVRGDLSNDEKIDAALFTSDKIHNRNNEYSRKPVTVGAGQIEIDRDELYLNKPSRIEQAEPKSKVDIFFESYAGKSNESDDKENSIFSPHISNVIPEKLVNVQAEATAPKQSSFDDSVKAYYEKPVNEDIPVKIDTSDIVSTPTIPETAVLPKGTIAPPKKKKNNKTLDELMSLIDAEENKLKK